ncbi:MAG: 4Fe-4S binding protein [Deltaproteobacteria bacterium]|uniref:Indolepyruvate oxidoreductase subunit IorA n=1 Tax=Candidatus Desulfacyla euxinica TaxID=2841693 RepID=A0A8J6N142_9DELT|nr:4Fe-4S binding protein [Candidatus Desulfacyla euxinica]
MSIISQDAPGKTVLLMGNEAIARGALEAGIKVCAAYPGNPSSEITGSLSGVADEFGLHVEWSVNEKVALEVATAASFAGLRGLCTMKQNGLNVASDFLLNLNLSGCEAGLVLVVADDPGALSSTNEEDSRAFAKLGDFPLLEPATFQEAKEMTKWAFDLSEDLGLPVLVRTVTRVSHARGNVLLDELPRLTKKPLFDTSKPRVALPVLLNHELLRDKLRRAGEVFETSPFNFFRGPEKPELLIITCGSGWMYSLEAVINLDLSERVGILKIGTTWPLPEQMVLNHLKKVKHVLFVEEVNPFLENSVKEFFAQNCGDLGVKRFSGKASGTLPDIGELSPDIVISRLQDILKVSYEPLPAEYALRAKEISAQLVPERPLGFCAGCPHRATYWAIKNALALDGRNGFVAGDIGCYSLGMGPSGFSQMKTLHAMGSGAGLAGGFGQLNAFGFDQPVIAVCGDSTFYHAVMPALTNASYNKSNLLLLLLDNSATAMTGFQPHPGTGKTATGHEAPILDLEVICKALGAQVEMGDPFEVEGTTETILRLLQDVEGVKVLILRRECALVRGRTQKKLFNMEVEQDLCLGEKCGCNRLCTRVFKCPGLIWDTIADRAGIDEAICTGCGVCADICPSLAIRKEVV